MLISGKMAHLCLNFYTVEIKFFDVAHFAIRNVLD